MVTCKIEYFIVESCIDDPHAVCMFVLCSLYLVEFTFNPNSIIEIASELEPQCHFSGPKLAFFCKTIL